MNAYKVAPKLFHGVHMPLISSYVAYAWLVQNPIKIDGLVIEIYFGPPGFYLS